MRWIERIQNAIDYIEEHITEKIDYAQIAKQAFCSSYHFQRVFGITCGVTVGEYIRMRKLTLAGETLINSKEKVIDVAYKFGYDTPESFSRAFYKFHKVLPSKIKGCKLNSFPRMTINFDVLNDKAMKYKVENLPEKILFGYKKRFSGVPYGAERERQEKEFFTTTRFKQWLLLGASCDYSTDYCIITDVDDDGYNFYIAYQLDEYTIQDLFDPKVTGVNFVNDLNFEKIVIPKGKYLIFETEKKKYPIVDYLDIRNKIITDWLPKTNYNLIDAPEVTVMHWRPKGEWQKERYIEIRLPIE